MIWITQYTSIQNWRGFTVRNGGNVVTVTHTNAGYGKITENIFHSNISGVSNPLTVLYTDGALISYNLFYDNGGINVIWTIGTSEIINNTIVDNERGIYCQGSNSVIQNNIITDNTDYAIVGEYAVLDYNNIWNNGWNNLLSVHGLSTDPLYYNSELNDYSLLPYSPCLDAGNPDTVYNDPDGTPNDMGAFPFDYALPIPLGLTILDQDLFYVVDHTPEFSWTYYTTSNAQYSFEIEVGTDNDWDTAELWSSGEIMSSDTSVVYAGSNLENGSTYFARARVNDGVTWGEWVVMYFRMNTVPSVPYTIYPIDDEVIHHENVRLFVENSTDAELSDLFYDFELYNDVALTDPVISFSLIPENPGFNRNESHNRS